MADTVRPGSVDDLCAVIAEAAESGGKLRLRGGGSKDAIGAPTPEARVIDMRGFAGVVDYDPPELVLTVGAGTPLVEIRQLVAEQGQMLAFDPFDHGAMLGGESGRATIGGVIAAGVAGPLRLSRGAARDHLLGFTGVSGRGERFVAGAKVVKNVTGYDLPKVVTGSWGRLVAITELTLKVLPAPKISRTLAMRGLAPEAAVTAMARALGSPAEVSAAAHLPNWNGDALTMVRIDGFPSSVDARAVLLSQLIDGLTPLAEAPWEDVRFAANLPFDRPLWRIITPATRAPSVVAAIRGEWIFDWAGGLIWLASDAAPETVRSIAADAGGHAMLFRADAATRARVPTLHPQPTAIGAIETRVRRAFDPGGVFETGRF